MEDKLFIRPATPDDVMTLLAIEQASFDSERISRRQMRYLLTRAKAITLIAEQEGKAVAYAMVFVPGLPRPARLYSIAVDQRFRGQKIAATLLNQLFLQLQQARYRRIRLEVRESQAGVQRLYQRLGFNELIRIPAYYEDGESAIRMEKNFLIQTDSD